MHLLFGEADVAIMYRIPDERAPALAILEFPLSDIRIAWLPHSFVRDHLARGLLVRVDDLLQSQALDIIMLRPSDDHSERTLNLWRHVTETLREPQELERVPDGAAGPVEPFQRTEE